MTPIIVILIIIGLAIGGYFVYKKIKANQAEGSPIEIEPGIPNSRPPVKKALLVGINAYQSSPLSGCVNDVENMRNILVGYGFEPDNIRVITDERATKAAIIDRLDWLISGSIAGDDLVFHYSGHGSQVRDRNGDELADQMDEILCPVDMNWDDPFLDDTLRAIFSELPQGVYLTMLSDSCHSGTVTRNPHNNRYLVPPFDIACRGLDRDLPVKAIGAKDDGATQRHVLFSGCKDEQTSADANINGKYQGAFTWALSSVINENPNITWAEAWPKVLNKIAGYSQTPQLSGMPELLNRKVFGGK